MTTGSKLKGILMRGLALLLLTIAGHAVGAEWGLEQLMQTLSSVKAAKAKFVERKYMSILNAPLESSGTLAYTAPDRLEKRTLQPKLEAMVLDRDRLTIESGERGTSRTLNLQQYPLVWALVEGIRSTLAGDQRTLSRFYQLTMEGNESRWKLILKPGDVKMKEVLTEIRISGSAGRIDAIETLEANGDRSVMTVSGDAS